MKIYLKLQACVLLSAFLSDYSFAAEQNSASQQVQMLNSQIQVQLQQLQQTQQQQILDLNTKLQAQMQKIQTTLEQELQTMHSQVQDQIKTMQANFNQQMQQISGASVQPSPAKSATPVQESK